MCGDENTNFIMVFSCLSFLGRDTVRSPAWFIGRDTVRSPYFSRVLIFRNMQGLRSPEIYLGFLPSARRPPARAIAARARRHRAAPVQQQRGSGAPEQRRCRDGAGRPPPRGRERARARGALTRDPARSALFYFYSSYISITARRRRRRAGGCTRSP